MLFKTAFSISSESSGGFSRLALALTLAALSNKLAKSPEVNTAFSSLEDGSIGASVCSMSLSSTSLFFCSSDIRMLSIF